MSFDQRKLPKPRRRGGHKQRYVYECTRCHQMPVPGDNLQSRDLLLQKKVLFAEMGTYGRVKVTRTVDWLCKDCLLRDPDYMAPPFPARRLISEIEDPEEYIAIMETSYPQEGDPGAIEPYRPAGY